ncbi:hypothetical protein IEO21_03325 [Rhodonia placenta]|uniref:DUF6697 domain-containing protein n=1 Tax=Rhodonia placenta TaxID=104341 RepID=A0A8H7P5Z7_9APHY|nr:hypothetical protein IEO21_03325 [Postia placenta]
MIELRYQFKEEQKDATDARPSKRSRATFADVTVLPFREVMRRARRSHTSDFAQGEEAAPEIKGEASEVEAVIKAEPKEEPLSAEELAATLEKYRNPHAKIKKDTQFDGAMVTDRLKAIGFERYPIDMEERLQRFLFNRHYIHNLYGGSFVDTFPSPSDEKVAIHGLNDFMFITLDLHPHAPLNPGDPGLFLNMVPADGTWGNARQVVRVFVRLRDTPKALWQYSGNYRMYPSESLTREEFARQPPLVSLFPYTLTNPESAPLSPTGKAILGNAHSTAWLRHRCACASLRTSRVSQGADPRRNGGACF